MALNLQEIVEMGREEQPKYAFGFRVVDFAVSFLLRRGLLPKNLEKTSLLSQLIERSQKDEVLATQANPVKLAVGEYSTSLHTPELYTRVFRTIWEDRQKKLLKKEVELDFSIPECLYTQEEIDQLEKEGKRLAFMPDSLSTDEARVLLNTLWPEMGINPDFKVLNVENRHGWFDYDSTNEAPFQSKDELELRQKIEEQGRSGMNLNEYIIASQDSRLLTGQYLDQLSSYSRLPGTLRHGYVIDVTLLNSRGSVGVNSRWIPQYSEPKLGGRSVKYYTQPSSVN